MVDGGGFEIIEIFGSGAFGTVCVARDLSHPAHPVVALKVLKGDYAENADALQRARDEARMLQRLRHPYIVRVTELREVAGRPVVVMEWIEGVSLDMLLRPFNNGVPVEAAFDLIRNTSIALDAAYYSPAGDDGRPMHIIHRDIRPSNILLSVRGEVKVVDFGQAKGEFHDREAVSEALVLGSRGYNAPERMMGVADSPAVDVYALGLTLFELLTAKKVVVSQREDKHDPAIQRHAGYLEPEGLEGQWLERLQKLFMNMCAYEADERPLPGQVARELDWILQGAHLRSDVLPEFAEEHVRAILDARRPQHPKKNERYGEIAFLESDAGRVVPLGAIDETTEETFRSFLDRSDWTASVKELHRMVERSATWPPKPLLEVLARASPPWWSFWTKAASPEELCVTLEALAKRPDPTVAHHARRLTHHADARVAELARALVDDDAS